MIDQIISVTWEMLKRNNIALAMVLNKNGDILWHKGREIKGKNIADGFGFPKNLSEFIDSEDFQKTETDVFLKKYSDTNNFMILLLRKGYFLYLDSDIKETFSEANHELFVTVGELLGEVINTMCQKGREAGGITGSSAKIKKVRELALRYSLEDEPVLLCGETGCGKNHIAGLIHHYSGKKGKLVTIHTPGIPENLLESEVFGHTKGAFTDARCDKKGLVEEAKEGTLFFDEIAEVPPSFQARLLRFIETKKYFKLGSTEEMTADVRIVAATNRNLSTAIENKQFREDLYYRLHVFELNIPPLRNRKEDITDLVTEEIKHLKGKQIGEGFWEELYNYDWPGNIRELQTVLKRAGILVGHTVTGRDIREIIHQGTLNKSIPTNEKNEILGKIRLNIKAGQNFWDAVKKPFLEREYNRDQVREFIRQALLEAGGKYTSLLSFFNLQAADYHRFMTFLNDYNLK